MQRFIYILLFSALFVFCTYGQDVFSPVLQQIEINNTTLKAYREKANADKIGNRTGINMANPEVEFGYLWGSPAEEGNRTDINVTQSFDFPTAYRYKSQLADARNKQLDLVYDTQRRQILQEARLICVETVYRMKMQKEFSVRLKQAKELSDAYQKRFDQGDIDVLERNKTKLDMLTAEKALQLNKVELNLLESELQRMNGGLPVSLPIDTYPDYLLSLDYSVWLEKARTNNPALLQARHQVELSRKQEQLTKALNLPKFTAGYTSERILGTSLQGFTIGVSVPLWEGKNTVKHQKAQTVALQMEYDDSQLQFRNTLKNQYDKAIMLSVLLKEYEEILKVTNNQQLLKIALEKGQLSLINYLLELSVYYDTMDKYLEAERDYQLAVAELIQWEN